MAYRQAELTWSLASVLDDGPARIDTFQLAHERFVRVLEMQPEGDYAKAAALGQILTLQGALYPGRDAAPLRMAPDRQ